MKETRTIATKQEVNSMTEKSRQVGSFSYNNETGLISGPADYMTTRFQDRMSDIYAGRNSVVNYGLSEGQEIISLVLVSLQTDYAAFLGMRQFNTMRGDA